MTSSLGTLQFTLTNQTDMARDARVVVFTQDRPDLQFGREVWLPPQSTITSWLTMGAASAEGKSTLSRELKYQLYERVDGAWKLILPSGDDRLRSRAVLYRKREPSTCILIDEDVREIPASPDLTSPLDRSAAAVQFARTFRLARGLSESLTPCFDPFLPSTLDAYEGTDQVIVAGNQIANDPIGLQTLRQWVMNGGTVWVMLDRVELPTVAPLLGNDCRFDIISRTSLPSVKLMRTGDDESKATARNFDRPVNFVRVRLSGNETVLYSTGGFPAAFSQNVGRGKILFTTLGEWGWYRPRSARERNSTFENHPRLPVPFPELERLSSDIYPEPSAPNLKSEDLEPVITSEIGYQVVGRETAGGILLAFVLGTLGLGLLMRFTRRPEVIGWIAPVLALGAAGAFVAFGLSSRRSVPPTVSVISIVEASPGTQEGNASGVAAIYRPEPGPVDITTKEGGMFEIDPSGLEGQPRHLIQKDVDVREWDQLSLPVGVRVGPFHAPVRLEKIAAVAQFGPDGLTGRFQQGDLKSPADSVLIAPGTDAFDIRLKPDGSFSARSEQRLPTGEYLIDRVVTDRQQRRLEVYRKYLNPMPRHLAGRTLLMTWVDTATIPVSVHSGDRMIGTQLLVLPVDLQPTPPDTAVTIPLGFISYGLAGPGKFARESSIGMDQPLRFTLPASAWPMTVERATLHLKVKAPGRKLIVSAVTKAGKQAVHQSENPVDSLRIEVTDPQLLVPDANGGLRFDLQITETIAIPGEPPPSDITWKIESLALEVAGRTPPKK
ncbi:MAG: hypothetical protein U0798_09845 [Gemmataceae bacterium]